MENMNNTTEKLLRLKNDIFFYYNNQELQQNQFVEYFSGPSNLALFRAVKNKSSWFSNLHEDKKIYPKHEKF